MKKLLFISSELPYPANSGGKIKSMKLVYFLAQKYEVTLATPLKAADATHVADFLKKSPCIRHIHEVVDVGRGPIALARSYLKNQSLNMFRTFDAGLKQRIEAIADEYDILLIDHYESSVYLPREFSGTVAYHAHNTYFQIWDRYAAQPGSPILRALAKLEALRVRRAETRLAHRADVVFAAPNDQAMLKKLGIAQGKIQETLHLGSDRSLDMPDVAYGRTAKSLLYIGTLTWEPNVQGLLWFIREVWPRVKAASPNIVFNVVGKDPDPRISALIKDEPRINLLGFVENLETVYPRNRISVAPLLFGSGMKVKVLDAMARGLPTVTTAVGAEGIDYRQGEHLLVARDSSEMASQITHLINDEEQWTSMQRASRSLIRRRYSWGPMLNAMYTALEAADSVRVTNDESISAPFVPAHA